MRLHLRSWGQGERLVVLIHGTASDSRTWHRAAPSIASLGHRVVAVDLRGHGQSPRGYYSPAAMAADLVDTLPTGADLVLGHSMGGALLALAVDELRPEQVVYAEPYWNVAALAPPPGVDVFTRFKEMTRQEITALNPRWTPADIDAEMAARVSWDPRTLVDLHTYDMPAPPVPTMPSLVLLAENPVAPVDTEVLREQGFEVQTLAGAGHTFYHDDLRGFLTAFERFLGRFV